MNLDELKMAWKEYDERLRATEELNQELIASMIRERSMSHVSRLRRLYFKSSLIAVFYLFCALSMIIGNVFDYTHAIEFLPLCIMSIAFAIMSVLFVRFRVSLGKVDFHQKSLLIALEEIIMVYRKPQRLIVIIINIVWISAGLIIVSFIPRKIETEGFWHAIFSISMPIVLFLIIYVIVDKLGLLTDKQEFRFKETLEEFNALKSRAAELKE